VSNEVGQSLWYLCTHSSVDSPRITALSVSHQQFHLVSMLENICTWSCQLIKRKLPKKVLNQKELWKY